MKQFKKRTLALVLASVVTVVGSFAAENYKNSLMGLDFVSNSNGNVGMVLQTKTNYSEQINPVRKDRNTYVLMLPEFNSEAPTPDLTKTNGCIESVNIKTMPYSELGKGYTRVIIKTFGNIGLTATSRLYIPTRDDSNIDYGNRIEDRNTDQPYYDKNESYEDEYTTRNSSSSSYAKKTKNRYSENQEKAEEQTATENIDEDIESTTNVSAPEDSEQVRTVQSNTSSQDTSQRYMLILGVFLLITISAFIYLKAKEKLVDVVGEKLEIDISDEEKPEKPKEKPAPQKAKKSVVFKPNTVRQTSDFQPKQNIKYAEPLDVVDLDKLFQEQNAQAVQEEQEQSDETENDFLEDFLKDFDVVEEKEAESVDEGPSYDEESYDRIINSSIKFTKDDIEGINKLLNSEIYEETINNIEKYAVSNPIAAPSKKEILEKMVTELAISQNITFTSSDISALRKLINVEIDPDFITDLRTNPERTKQMTKEIETHDVKPIKSKIGTLHVKEMLPNLSEELSKQGKKIESDGVKPMTVYYSEGYEYTKLKVDDLPDLAAEVHNRSAYTSKPSYKEKIVETGYEYDSFATDGSLPDLADVMAHPEKYKEKPKEKAKADENEMLERILNVQFKPFDDGSREFEVLNDFENEPVPSVNDIQQEFSQFGNLKIADEEQDETSVANSPDYDDFEVIYDNNFVDLDKDLDKEQAETNEAEHKEENDSAVISDQQEQKETQIISEQEIIPEPVVEKEPVSQQKVTPKHEPIVQQKPAIRHDPEPAALPAKRRETPQKSDELLKKIEASRRERAILRENAVTPNHTPVKVQQTPTPQKEVTKCLCDGVSYDILDSVSMGQNIGCHLAKNENGYVIFAYNGDNLSKLKEYPSVRVEKIQARLSERIAAGTPRYIVRVGANKFIVDIKDNDICYVMDLC